ncbi:tail protein X [Emcibacter sp.]|uniref:tail protein X n=1 Tax=Emcibacter sp. TaxID=1979954 RepID=UPI002AA82548|nr:tail protein X [Emcibacter sp.]
MTTYITREGDAIDYVCKKHYGDDYTAPDQVYAANPGLAAYGPILPAGLTITLPEIETEAIAETVSLWD